MNKFIVIFLLGIITVSCGTKKVVNNNFVNGWYLVSRDIDKTNLIQKVFLNRKIFIESNPIMEINHNTIIKLGKRNWGKEVNVIEIIFNGKSKEKWFEVTKKLSETKEELVFIYKNKILTLATLMYKNESGYSIIYNSNLTIKELNQIVLDLKSQIKD